MLRKKPFLKAILVATFTIIIISTLFMNYTNKKEKNQIRYETYIVQEGDTLWKIAKRYTDGDPRRLIYEIRKHNDISPIIRPGQVIEVPIVDRNVD